MNRMSDTISQTIYQLDSEKRQLWYILSSFTDGVAALDNTGNLTHYNPALMKMFGAVDVKTPHDLIPDTEIWEAFRRVLETREPNTLRYTLPGEKYLWISIVPVMGENDTCTGVVGLFKDVTEIENMENEDGDVILDADLIRSGATKVYEQTSTAYQLVDILTDAVKTGTGKQAKLDGFTVAGKTGTNSKYSSVYFAGMTCDYTAVVWIGHDLPSNKLKTGSTGGDYAAALWKAFMEKLMEGRTDRPIIDENTTMLGMVRSFFRPA